MQTDIRELKPGVVHRLRAEPITTTQLVKYAGASGDFNRIHFDEPYARENGLPGVIAHGMLTMAIAGRCLSEIAGDRWRIADFSSRFLSPVLVGDVVEIAATVLEADTGEDGVRLHVEGKVGDKDVLKGEALLVARGVA